MMRVFIAPRAKKAMEKEISRFPNLETGGMLLGYSDGEKEVIQVLEATDSGYQNTVHEENVFEYDSEYVEHMCVILSELYDPPLELEGVWHKHNSVCVTHFSRADEEMHRQLLEITSHPCVSILYEKIDKKEAVEDIKEEYILYVLGLKHGGNEEVCNVD